MEVWGYGVARWAAVGGMFGGHAVPRWVVFLSLVVVMSYGRPCGGWSVIGGLQRCRCACFLPVAVRWLWSRALALAYSGVLAFLVAL